ncbi:MAG: prepilin peptidase, partial [Candidatus Parcubacteria bacterium]|nr:prepilin peptidase [Candidatus Parcubacteria bacterium]
MNNILLLEDWLFIVLILIIGIIICYEDFKSGKIRNKWIKLGLILGLIYYIISLVITILGNSEVINISYYPFGYFLSVLLNTLLTFIVAFTLWHFKLWAGGDAKLFTLYAFLIPLDFYSNWQLPYWPSLTLLINIILPIFIYLLIRFLLYPIRLGISYLKNPQLLREYYRNFKNKNKIDKTKFREYLSLTLSFLLILILFQILRTRLSDVLSPYLGQVFIGVYFLLGFVVFQPLRTLLQKKVIFVTCLVLAYFVIGAIFFREIVFADLHRLFALQFIFILSYYYIFKYGQALGRFLYNSAEVKMVPLAELQAGIYINKDYIRQIMGSRLNFDDFQNGLDNVLPEEDKKQLLDTIKLKTDKTQKEKQQYQWLSLLRNFRLDSLPNLIKQLYQYKKQKETERALLQKVKAKLSNAQNKQLENILTNTDEFQMFLKSV